MVSFLKRVLFSPSQIIMCRLHLNYLLRSKYFRSTTVGEHYTIEVGAKTVTAAFSNSSARCHLYNSALSFLQFENLVESDEVSLISITATVMHSFYLPLQHAVTL